MALTICSCSSSKIVKHTISQIYYNNSFSPELVTKKGVNATEITVTPVDAKSLDKETFDAAFRDGNYGKEFITELDSWKSELAFLSKSERAALQGKLNAFECLTILEKEGKIPAYLSIYLKRRIADIDQGKTGTEVESLADIDFASAIYNPYKVNETYFSVFKLTFENKGSEIDKINIKEFQLTSNEEQLYPLASEYFEVNLKGSKEKIKNSYRLNMPNELIITPGQRVSKYIAVPAINSLNNKLQVQFIRNSNVINFEFSVVQQKTEKTYNLEQFQFKYEGEGDEISYKPFYVVRFKNNNSFALQGNKVFISDQKKFMQADVYAIGINPISSEIVFGAAENFTFSSVINNKKKINFIKMKRDKKTGQY